MKTIFASLFAASLVMVSAGPGTAASSKRKVCKELVTANATEAGLKKAEIKAREQWIEQVLSMYSTSWANPENARIKNTSCVPKSSKILCVFNAHPCRWESALAPPSLKPGLRPKITPDFD